MVSGMYASGLLLPILNVAYIVAIKLLTKQKQVTRDLKNLAGILLTKNSYKYESLEPKNFKYRDY